MTHTPWQEFRGQQALITGGSSGIGLELARQLAAGGAHVTLLARRQPLLEAACQELEGLRASPVQQFDWLAVDVGDQPAVAAALGDYAARRGAPHLLVNSAGLTMPGLFHRLDLQVFEELMRVDYFGALYVTRALLPAMLERRSGVIVNISSVAALAGAYGYSAYAPAKNALRSLSETLAVELRPCGIHVCTVFPADTETPQLEFEKPYRPYVTEQLARTIGLSKPAAVAVAILRGVQKRQYIILPGFEAWFSYRLANLLGRAYFPVMNAMVAFFLRRADPEDPCRGSEPSPPQ